MEANLTYYKISVNNFPCVSNGVSTVNLRWAAEGGATVLCYVAASADSMKRNGVSVTFLAARTNPTLKLSTRGALEVHVVISTEPSG